ncbi:MAG: ABC transporter permease [Solirubrobacterales bacterium]|nr:ABC transporter permease [Solirubrobacterales bacterium]
MAVVDQNVPGGAPEPDAEAGEVYATGNPWVLVARTFVQNRLAVVGLVLIVVLLLFSLIGPLIYHAPSAADALASKDQGPGGGYLLGTDSNGSDIMTQLMKGGQSSLLVGFVVGIFSTVLGLVYGAIAGFFGKALDNVMMRIIDIGLAIPVVFLFVFLAQVLKPNLLLLIGMLTAVSWLLPARLVRGESLSLRTREYVQAVRGMGGGSWRIIARHLIPNTIGTITVTITFQIANAVLVLAILQYLGFGLPPTTPTWGNTLFLAMQNFQDGYWWEVYPALVLIVLTVLAFNFVGDALQDAFDVRLQER